MRIVSTDKDTVNGIKEYYAVIDRLKQIMINALPFKKDDMVEIEFSCFDHTAHIISDEGAQSIKEGKDEFAFTLPPTLIQKRKAYIERITVTENGDYDILFAKARQDGSRSYQSDDFRHAIKIISITKV